MSFVAQLALKGLLECFRPKYIIVNWIYREFKWQSFNLCLYIYFDLKRPKAVAVWVWMGQLKINLHFIHSTWLYIFFTTIKCFSLSHLLVKALLIIVLMWTILFFKFSSIEIKWRVFSQKWHSCYSAGHCTASFRKSVDNSFWVYIIKHKQLFHQAYAHASIFGIDCKRRKENYIHMPYTQKVCVRTRFRHFHLLRVASLESS